jgi:hypothetical protein
MYVAKVHESINVKYEALHLIYPMSFEATPRVGSFLMLCVQ